MNCYYCGVRLKNTCPRPHRQSPCQQCTDGCRKVSGQNWCLVCNRRKHRDYEAGRAELTRGERAEARAVKWATEAKPFICDSLTVRDLGDVGIKVELGIEPEFLAVLLPRTEIWRLQKWLDGAKNR